ncbi:hypothetical protein AB0M54_29565 [Actinoplanes sp. NPDC051470]|uniref:hypothetical protein n=1 Tax=unclassified Actinoplanes TaxID=2626549 RepID=UPI0034137B62
MKALRRFGTLGVAMIVAVASLMLGAAPASAAGDTRYENMGNPGWCLDGDGSFAYLHACNAGNVFQVWNVGDAGWMELKHKQSNTCLKALSNNLVGLSSCGELGTSWHASGKNGWVKFVSAAWGFGKCLRPYGTEQGGQPTYDLAVLVCNPDRPNDDPYATDNVPNIVAWRFH